MVGGRGEHAAGGFLREEEGAAGVDGEDPVEVVGGEGEEVASLGAGMPALETRVVTGPRVASTVSRRAGARAMSVRSCWA